MGKYHIGPGADKCVHRLFDVFPGVNDSGENYIPKIKTAYERPGFPFFPFRKHPVFRPLSQIPEAGSSDKEYADPGLSDLLYHAASPEE
jgi:hypothetical protein